MILEEMIFLSAKSRVVSKQTVKVPSKIEIAPMKKVEGRLRLRRTLSSRPRLLVRIPVPEVVQYFADNLQISF